ncbi:MAG TPA: hypothetical protein VMT18_04520, partial [Planctomycetota bacterium]|nr:hypothetical protein [Planctomycetota bacterium]
MRDQAGQREEDGPAHERVALRVRDHEELQLLEDGARVGVGPGIVPRRVARARIGQALDQGQRRGVEGPR